MSAPVYSYCESIHASSKSRWCIRLLTEAGPKYGGGIDTPSLCGHVKQGWDIKVPIDERNLASACPTCAELYLGQQASSTPH